MHPWAMAEGQQTSFRELIEELTKLYCVEFMAVVVRRGTYMWGVERSSNTCECSNALQ
jgi:hypothetical protein